MLEIHRHSAPLAIAARACGPGLRAEKELAKPERESVVSLRHGVVDEQARGKGVGGPGP